MVREIKHAASLRAARLRAAAFGAGALGVSSAWLGCSPNEAIIGDASGLCPAELPLDQALGAVVSLRVTQARSSDSLTCSGVAIAPELVLTALHCVMRPPATSPRCDPNDRWQPVETGDGASRFGEPFELASMSVYVGTRPPASDRGFARVREVIPSGATSRCTDDFAILVLDCPLTVEPVPLRLEARATRLGERLIVSGFGGAAFPSPRRELEGEVLLVASDEGDVRAPPRSILLSAPACSFDHGGAVLSPETGALVGTVVTGTGVSCDDPAGNTVAVHLAPFRQLFVDAAARAGTVLRVESNPEQADTTARACDSLASAPGDDAGAGPSCASP